MRGLFRPSLIAAIVFACAVHPPMATAAPPDRDSVAVTAPSLHPAVMSESATVAPLALYVPSVETDTMVFAAASPLLVAPTPKPVRTRATVFRERPSSRPTTLFAASRDRPPANDT